MLRGFLIAIVMVSASACAHPFASVGVKQTARLTIAGAGRDTPIFIRDSRTLALSNVFAGTFLGSRVEAPKDDSQRYVITFDVRGPDRIKEHAYEVIYVRDAISGSAFVYLPGPGDRAYRNNRTTILRDGQDGQWHHASDAWAQAINTHLQ